MSTHSPAGATSTERPEIEDVRQAGSILASIGDGVITADTEGVVTYINAAAERLTGWSAREAVGQTLDTLLVFISDKSRLPVPNTAARSLVEGRSVDLEGGVSLVRRDGTEVPIGDSAAPVVDSLGNSTGVVLVLRDESASRRVGQRLSYEATHDLLTGLNNRREIERRLQRVLSDLSSGQGEHVLLYIDLDRFKVVNDTCGHAAGDELLRHLGTLFRSNLRKRDTLARLGGDEFGILLESCPLHQARQIAESLRSGVERLRFVYAGRTFRIGASIGLLPLMGRERDVAAVMRVADAACYAAKKGGGNRVHLALRRLGAQRTDRNGTAAPN